MGVPSYVIKSINRAIESRRENRIITKYKLEESIKAKFKNLGAEDLANNIIEYINLLLNENYDNNRED